MPTAEPPSRSTAPPAARLRLTERNAGNMGRETSLLLLEGRRWCGPRAESRSSILEDTEYVRGCSPLTILLSNDGVLPLAPALRRVAVVGPGADDERLLQGDYHYPAHLEGIYLQAHDPSGDGILGDGEVLVPHAGGAYAAGPHFTPHITPLAGLRH